MNECMVVGDQKEFKFQLRGWQKRRFLSIEITWFLTVFSMLESQKIPKNTLKMKLIGPGIWTWGSFDLISILKWYLHEKTNFWFPGVSNRIKNRLCFINNAQFFAIFRWFFVKYGSLRVIPDFSNSLYIFDLLFRICFSSRWLEQTRKKK